MLNIVERLNTLDSMRKVGLNASLTRDYTVEQLASCCQRLEELPLQSSAGSLPPRIQAVLVADPTFAARFERLLSCGMTAAWIDKWLEQEKCTGCHMADLSDNDLLSLMSLSISTMTLTHDYARFYLPQRLDATTSTNVVNNMNAFAKALTDGIGALSEAERDLFKCAFLCDYIESTQLRNVLPKLVGDPALVRFLDWLSKNQIDLYLSSDSWAKLEGFSEEMLSALTQILGELLNDTERMWKFLSVWLENGAHLNDLHTFARWIRGKDMDTVDAALSTQISYLNALYGGYLTGIPFSDIGGFAYPLMSYAIINRQKTFLRMVADNFATFQTLPYGSMLFFPSFYTRIALNSITAANLKECETLVAHERRDSHLELLEKRMYTFQELRTLFLLPKCYVALYRQLNIPRVDDRLLAFRQVTKRNLLPEGISEAEVSALAACLSEQPLSTWRDHTFSHISGLTLPVIVNLLSVYEQVQRFLPEIHNADEASFLVRHHDVLQDYADWQDVRRNIEQIDTDWAWLRGELELDDAFVQAHEQEILAFLYREGASISRAYANKHRDSEGFYRIIRAVLMGQYEQLKYHANDLQLEISYPLTEWQKFSWMENLRKDDGNISAEERDDFFTTMQIGVIPQRTCLNYADGACRECLLACFDSNKKFLYATINDKPVARAMLRLTKGSFKSPKETKSVSLEFADLRKPNAENVQVQNSEELVLFLERMYTSGIDQQVTTQIQKLFIAIIEQKSKELGAQVVLSDHYRAAAAEQQYTAMNYYLYISKSKAGAQYLDSLGGSADVSSEGSYKRNMFLLPI